MTRGERNIRWIENNLVIPDGKFMGKPFRVTTFQRIIILGIYDTPTRTALISVGRKNAKTTTAAALLLLHTCGPEAKPNSELFSSALSRDQASIIFRLAAKMVRLSPRLSSYVNIRDTAKQLACPDIGTLYTALSADASTSFGLSPAFCVHDELGQVRGPQHKLYDALETATAAHEEPLSIVISTQAATDADLLSVLIDDAKEENDPETKLFLWTADIEADPFDPETIRQANPAFDEFQNQKEILKMAEAARRMPSREAEYRNLILNQRVEAQSPFVTLTTWKENGKEPVFGSTWYGGLDLSETNDLTALVLVSPVKGLYDVMPIFFLPADGIEERSRKDRVPYDVWAKQGHIALIPGRSVEYEHVAKYMANLFEKHDIRKIAFDRYNMRHLRPWLSNAGLSDAVIEDRFEDFGQGFVSMSPALRNLESVLLNATMRHGMHPVLTMCAANAVVRSDEAGNRKLDKKRSRGRIDGMVALTMATSLANAAINEKHVYESVSVDRLIENLTS